MSSKTKIVVLHMKEVIYTIIFVVLAILLAVLLFMMFGKDRKADSAATSAAVYHAGVYKSPITLNGNTFDVEVTVDENHINAISLVNLSETTTAMYPLMEPALDALSSQIYASQTTENITYTDENKYTSMLLLDAINEALDKAKADCKTMAGITGRSFLKRGCSGASPFFSVIHVCHSHLSFKPAFPKTASQFIVRVSPA